LDNWPGAARPSFRPLRLIAGQASARSVDEIDSADELSRQPIPVAKVRVARIDTGPEAARAAIPLLDEEEQSHAETIRHAETANEWVCTRAWLRRILSTVTGEPPKNLRFQRHCRHCGDLRHGKPTLADYGWLDFSLAHAGPYGICAYASGVLIGADIEPLARTPPPLAGFCSTQERAAVMRSLRPSDAALRLWVRKEAITKAFGFGLAMEFCSVAVLKSPTVVKVGTTKRAASFHDRRLAGSLFTSIGSSGSAGLRIEWDTHDLVALKSAARLARWGATAANASLGSQAISG
jgi:4'-phosphopantetheinyl transferase